MVLLGLLTAFLLSCLPLLVGAVITAGVVRGVLEQLDWTTDDPNSDSSPTWVEIPILQVMQDQAQHPQEVGVLTPTINNLQASAASENTFVYPVSLKDSDTFLDGLVTAANNLTPVWFRVRPKGKRSRIVGGWSGCLVSVDRMSMPGYGSLTMAIIRGSCTAADAGETFTGESGSGS